MGIVTLEDKVFDAFMQYLPVESLATAADWCVLCWQQKMLVLSLDTTFWSGKGHIKRVQLVGLLGNVLNNNNNNK